MANETNKIDKIQIGTVSYEINLPTTATLSISSLTLSKDLTVLGNADLPVISEDDINETFETVFGKVEVDKNTTVKKLLDARKSAASLFANYEGTSVDDFIKYNDTSNVINMNQMFSNCRNLTTIPQLDTNNVTNMNGMFRSCNNLTTIPSLNTSNVTNMGNMFNDCSKLTTIPELDTSKVTDMGLMFNGCSNLITIPLLDTGNVTDMYSMFENCSSLITIPAFDVSNVTGITSMTKIFSNCSNLIKISMLNIANNLDISDCTKMEREAIVEVLNNLKDLTGQTSKKLTLGSTLLAKLTAADKTIATNKNWTLA